MEALAVRIQMCNDSTAASNNWQPEGNLWRWSQAAFFFFLFFFLAGWKGWCQRARLKCMNTVSKHLFYYFPSQPSQRWRLHLVSHKPQFGIFFFSRGPLDSTQFRPEAPQKCSQRLFNHSAQIIQRVSPQVSLCPYVRDFLSLCVLYSAAFPWDFLRTFQTGAHLDAAGSVSAHCDAVWCAMAGQSVSLIWRGEYFRLHQGQSPINIYRKVLSLTHIHTHWHKMQRKAWSACNHSFTALWFVALPSIWSQI